jgi:amidase/aspartyl-tRNA(Asn)/glutamyl-tRNA(Gln) amidotransferase subunit A
VLGKTNTPEFGHKGVTDNLLFGPTRNPFNPARNAGGSSGGSAAAVAAGLVPIAQGSDGGGSLRIPASCCGLYAIKASFGRVPVATRPNAFGLHTPFALMGPMARTVEDAGLMLGVMAGPHPRDPFSLPDQGIDYLACTRRSVQGLRLAYSPDLGVFPVDPRVRGVVEAALPAFEAVGAHVETVRVGLRRPQGELSALWLRQIGVSHATTFEIFKRRGIDLLGEHRDELPPQFVAVVEAGQRMSAVQAKLGDVIRTEVYDALQDVFERYDLLLTPTLASPPPPNGSDGITLGPTAVNGEPVDPLIGWCLTYPLNFSGHPAASIPAGLTDDGLPIGLQIVGRRFADDTVLAASAAFERARPWRHTYPLA